MFEGIYFERCRFCGEALTPEEARRGFDWCSWCEEDYETRQFERVNNEDRAIAPIAKRCIQKLNAAEQAVRALGWALRKIERAKPKPKHDEDCLCPDCASFPGTPG